MKPFSSIALFKNYIVEEIPEYALLTDVQILDDCKWFLGINKDGGTPSNEIIAYTQKIAEDRDDLIVYFISEIAMHYVETNATDEIITELLKNEDSNFHEIHKQVRQVSKGINDFENAQNKKILQNLEASLQGEELTTVLQRIERKENKKILKDLESQFVSNDLEFAKTGNDSNHFHALIDQDDSRSRRFSTKSFMRIAAILILFAIPSTIMLFMVGNGKTGETNTAKNNKTNKTQGSQEFYASTMVDIELPNLNEIKSSADVKDYYDSQGFGSSELKIEVLYYNLKPQLNYLLEKRYAVIKYRKVIDKKQFKHKKTTIDSLNVAIQNLEKLEGTFIAKDKSYKFDKTSLALYFIIEKDLQGLKVFNYNERDKNTYYLYMEGKFYELQIGKGKLISLQDEDRIEVLEELSSRTP
jgi:hypothetical protein